MAADVGRTAAVRRGLVEFTRRALRRPRSYSHIIRAFVKARICLSAAIILAVTQSEIVQSSTPHLSSYGTICISVFDLTDSHKYRVRDDISDRIAPTLNERTQKLARRIRILSRPNCLKPNQYRYSQQISLEMFVKRQVLTISGKQYNVVVVGGSSSNAQGVLSDYELQPILLVRDSQIPDDDIEKSLSEYVDTRVLSLMR